jgi:hypothetical protein
MNEPMQCMAFELPAVTFDPHETRISTGDGAVYVKPNDVRECAEAIVSLLGDEDHRPSGQDERIHVTQERAWCHQKCRLPRCLPAPNRRTQGPRRTAEV